MKGLGTFFPDWYQQWLFTSLNIMEGQETSEKYLNPLFNLNKNWLKENYDKTETAWNERDTAKAYALYYMSINIPKLWMVMENSFPSANTPDSVTEYGCGPGTFLWAYLFYLRAKKPEQLKEMRRIKGIDSSSENIKVATSLFDKLTSYPEFSHLKAEFITADWRDYFKEDENVFKIFGNSLVETDTDPEVIAKGEFSRLLIIEPGTLKHFQRLRKIRDRLIQEKLQILFPCMGGESCPLAEDNWCHFHVNRFILPFVQSMSSAAGRKNHRHNFSAFYFSRENRTASAGQWRLLSPVRKVKRTAIRYICNGEKVIEAVLSRKERSAENRDFIDSPAGSKCFCSNELKNMRIKSNDTFKNI